MKILRNLILDLAEHLNIRTTGKWLVYGIIIGVVAGLGSVAFFYLLKFSQDIFLHTLGGYHPPVPVGEAGPGGETYGVFGPRWVLALVPGLGGLLAGFIIYTFAPEAEGHGTDAMIDSFHRGRGKVRPRVPFIKMIASAVTIGSGGSAGREGPIAQIGSGVGSYLASLLRLSDRERRIMLLAGAGAGIGGIFKAPLGGALFATEVLYRAAEFEFEAIIPCMIASIVSYSVFSSIMGWEPIFAIPDLQFHNPYELLFYGALGVCCAIIGIFYIRIFYGFRDKFFARIPIKNHFKPALGGIMLGAMAFFLPQTMEMGYGYVQLAIFGKMKVGEMFSIAIAKIFATSFTISSGGSGGVFAPSLTIGALLGGAFGHICHHFFPDVITHPEAFVLVGMGGFFAGAAKVPIASIIMVCEMTGGYGLLVPLMFVALVTYLLTYRWSLYEKQVATRVNSPAHRGDFIIDILEYITVNDALPKRKELKTIPEGMNFRKILDLVSSTTASQYPIVNAQGELTGMLTLDTVRKVIQEEEIFDLLVAKDLGNIDFPTVTPQDNLNKALDKLTKIDQEEILVVDEKDPKRILDLLSRRDIIIAYNRELQEQRRS
jgi:CIC family chloride channel protein